MVCESSRLGGVGQLKAPKGPVWQKNGGEMVGAYFKSLPKNAALSRGLRQWSRRGNKKGRQKRPDGPFAGFERAVVQAGGSAFAWSISVAIMSAASFCWQLSQLARWLRTAAS